MSDEEDDGVIGKKSYSGCSLSYSAHSSLQLPLPLSVIVNLISRK